MPKNTQEDNEELKKKLDYLGLNLDRIPKTIKEFKPFSFRVTKSYDDTSYKVYKYIPVEDIEILLTPTDRLTDLNQKYKLSAPIDAYLDSKSESNIEKFTCFLKMLNEMNIEKIEEIEKEQEKLKKTLPYEIKYPNNYIWQIYYSDISDQYFMLVPTNEINNSAFFYLLKKKIESSKSRKKEYIFAPITHGEYLGTHLLKTQITDLENYLWYFTKEWPNIFEVYDLKGKPTLKIIGKAKVYEDIKSDYVVTLDTRQKALDWYKLVKALFILSTGLPNDYTFKMQISEDGEIEFFSQDKIKLEYQNLPVFIMDEVKKKKILVELENNKISGKQDKLEELKKDVESKTQEFLSKERQIATFLACKKSFFGKIKYYFGNRKKYSETIQNKQKIKENKENEREQNSKFEMQENVNYTIEDLIEICTKLDGRIKVIKNLEMDAKALELKKINLERKIKNANIYLNEIELHKKSIFEFWKFTAKDELPSLNEGEEQENEEKQKIGKSFTFEEDIEDLGKQMDELQRRKLSKNETDSIFAIKQVIKSAQILYNTKSQDLTKKEMAELQKELDSLKKEYEKDFETIKTKDFDIFGGFSDDQTKVKVLSNEKHREVEKDKYKVLNITPNTELSEFIDNLRNYLKLVQEAFCKISTMLETSIYIAETSQNKITGLNIANLNATGELFEKAKNLKDGESLNLYTLIIPKDSPLLYYTNIIEFDNLNQTLPVGMNVTTKVLVDLNKYNLELKEEKEFRINYQIDEYTNKIIKITAICYKVNIL